MKRVIRTTTTAHIPKRPVRRLDDNLNSIFCSLKEIIKVYDDKLEVKADNEFYYELWTNRGYRIKSSRPKSRKGIAFAAIIAFKKYIGFYFLPLSGNAALREKVKPELSSFSKGLYTFHFDSLNPVIIEQLEEIVKEGWLLYRQKGWVLCYPFLLITIS